MAENEVVLADDEDLDLNPGWENAPTVADLKQDYTDAQSDKDAHDVEVERWLDNLNITGTALKTFGKNRSSVQPKLIRKQAEWRYASLSEPFLSTEDIFNVRPIGASDKEAATQNALVLNNQFNTKIQKVRFIDEYVRTAVDEGTVIVRVGWDSEEEEQEVEVPDMEWVAIEDPAKLQQITPMLEQAQQVHPSQLENQLPPEAMEMILVSMEAGMPMEKVQIGSHMEVQTVLTKNQPTIEICPFRNITIDPSCGGDLTKAAFVVYSFESSRTELEKDGKYQNIDAITANSHSVLGDPDYDSPDSSSFDFKDKPRQRLVVNEYWGYWDINDDGIVRPIVAAYVGDVMIRLEESPFPDGELPFVSVQLLPVRRSLYGEPDGELLEDNQKIIGAVTRGMIDIMGRSANGQVGSSKDALDITNKRKFDNGLNYEYNPGTDPTRAFYMHTYPEIPQSAAIMIASQNQDAESLTGVKAFTTGISGEALGTTATGVRSAMDATSKRELGILRRLAEGVKQIGRKVIAMNAVFLADEEIIRVTENEFVPVQRDDLKGNFDLELSISTAEADNQKAEELAFMLQTTAQSMGPEISQMILSEIATLRKMPALAKQIREFQPAPDPVQQQIQQLEVMKLQAEIAKLQSEATENNAEAQLDQAKAVTEQAKANDLTSSADLKNLDFIEQESGTTQERDLQKAGRQAASNTVMKDKESQLRKEENREKAIFDMAKQAQSTTATAS